MKFVKISLLEESLDLKKYIHKISLGFIFIFLQNLLRPKRFWWICSKLVSKYVSSLQTGAAFWRNFSGNIVDRQKMLWKNL